MADTTEIVARHVPVTPYEPTGYTAIDDTAWMEDAACLDVGPDVFELHPEIAGAESAHRYYDARIVCAGCTVREQCLEWALAAEEGTGEVHDFVGGKSPSQRRRILRNRRAGR